MAFELEANFGDEAAREFRTALRALHAFAQRTGCKPGGDVIQWFAIKNDELQDAARTAALREDQA